MRTLAFWAVYGVLVQVAAGQNSGKTQIDPLSSGRPYSLGPGDQIVLQAANAEEISGKPFRIETDGNVNLPLLGQMHLAGLTVEQVEAKVRTELAKYVRDPEVTISVTQFRSETVTFTGAFRMPGTYPLQGRHTLTEMLTLAGGLAENGSRILRITRQETSGPIPLPNSRLRVDGTSYVADLDTTIAERGNPADDFILQPFDVVTAFAVEPIVIGGEITHAGVVPLGDHKSLPLLQVVLMQGGATPNAAKKHVKIFRQDSDSGNREELDVNLEKIQKGESPDFALLPRDLVIIPRADGRVISKQALAIATGLAVSVIAGMLIVHH
jgi:polysaccharide export outer membrane protein